MAFFSRATRRGRGRGAGPTARTTITGDPEDFLFLLLYSRGLSNLSAGVQIALDDLLQVDERAQHYYEAATAVAAKGRELYALDNDGEEPDRETLWRFLSENLDSVMAAAGLPVPGSPA